MCHQLVAIPKNVASVSGRSTKKLPCLFSREKVDKSKVVFDLDLGEPQIGETPEDFQQDLEGCFMTQAIVASYYCWSGHGGLLDPTIIKVKIPQSHPQSVEKNEDPNLFRSEKLHPAVQQCFIMVASLSFYALTRWRFPPFEDIFNPKLVEMIPKLTCYHFFRVGLATQPPTPGYHGLPPQKPMAFPQDRRAFRETFEAFKMKDASGLSASGFLAWMGMVSWSPGSSWFMNVYPYTTMGSKNLAGYIPNNIRIFPSTFWVDDFHVPKGGITTTTPLKTSMTIVGISPYHLILATGDTSSKDCFPGSHSLVESWGVKSNQSNPINLWWRASHPWRFLCCNKSPSDRSGLLTAEPWGVVPWGEPFAIGSFTSDLLGWNWPVGLGNGCFPNWNIFLPRR